MPVDNTTSDYEYAQKNYGFNWADGHLKSYANGYNIDGSSSDFSISAGVRAVRGEEGVYGVNNFDNTSAYTITDNATGLMWSKYDDGYINDDGTIMDDTDEGWGEGKTWTDTLTWVQTMNDASYGGHDDWRLPDVKELQSIVEYEKTVLPALDDGYFTLSREDCFVWSSTTCGDFTEMADYIAIGRGYGINLDDNTDSSSATVNDFVDTHGSGCMRADYKDTESTTTSLTTNYTVSQAPLLSREKWLDIYGFDTDDMSNYPYDYTDDTFTEFDLTNSENAADYIVLYNYALLVRDTE
ncbi:MAG: hypothetical protein BKP49_10390 [Treponema sp. CETP13]|nr:MAG: hypothetical protein BKP49_10390 [Treponema sp. CETP13]